MISAAYAARAKSKSRADRMCSIAEIPFRVHTGIMRTTILLLSVLFLGCETNTAGIPTTAPDAAADAWRSVDLAAPDLRPAPDAVVAPGPEAGPEAAPDTEPTAECLYAAKCCVAQSASLGRVPEWDCRDIYEQIALTWGGDCCAYSYAYAKASTLNGCSVGGVQYSGCPNY
jgi:hypothetical protein